MKIATHNSATGEEGGGLLSWLVSPFARCQSKTLVEQYQHGCRYFDFRIKWNERKRQHNFAHGLWRSKESFPKLAFKLYNNVRQNNDSVYIMLTYEGQCEEEEIKAIVNDFEKHFPNHFKLTTANIKRPTWRTIVTSRVVLHENCYKVLDGNTWHTYLPIPWLWAKIHPPTYHPKKYNFVDFL